MTDESPSSGPSEQTRRALIDAAITLFGTDGFRGTSTRAIAQKAGTNIASIAYHFGGKEALRVACGTAIAERIGNVLGDLDFNEVQDPDQAVRILEQVATVFLHFLLLEQDEANFVAFMLRELTEDGPVLQEIYERAFAPRHRAFCRLWEAATGLPAESEQTRLTVFSLIGQALYFRIGQTLVQRRMGWDKMNEARVKAITDVLVANLRAAVKEARRTET